MFFLLVVGLFFSPLSYDSAKLTLFFLCYQLEINKKNNNKKNYKIATYGNLFCRHPVLNNCSDRFSCLVH